MKRYTQLVLLTSIAALIFSACGPLTRDAQQETAVPTINLEPPPTWTPTLQPSSTPAAPAVTATLIPEPTELTATPSAGFTCQSDSLRIAASLPDNGWRCDSEVENWLAISSPTFEIQMSTLGRGVFCNESRDPSCSKTPFYANDILESELWSVSEQPKEIFGFTVFQRDGANLWISIHYKDMETQPLDTNARAELLRVLDSLRETGVAGTPAPEPAPQRIEFAPGASSATLQGTLDGEIQAEYLLWAAAGQTMMVSVTSPNTSVLFHIQGVDDHEVYKHLLDGELSWQGVLPLSQDYLITLDAVGGATSYTLDVAVTTAPPPEPSAERIRFPLGATSVTLEGILEPPQRDFYVFAAQAGQQTTIEIVSESNRANFGLSGVSDGQPYRRVENEDRVWSAVLPQTQDYLLTVAAPADAPTTGYQIRLTIEPLD